MQKRYYHFERRLLIKVFALLFASLFFMTKSEARRADQCELYKQIADRQAAHSSPSAKQKIKQSSGMALTIMRFMNGSEVQMVSGSLMLASHHAKRQRAIDLQKAHAQKYYQRYEQCLKKQ